MQVDPSSITKASESAHATVKERALQILRMLGSDEEPNPPEATATSSNAHPSGQPAPDPVGDLLGGLDDDLSSLNLSQDPLGVQLFEEKL